MTIHKDDILNKNIEYIDRNKAFRIGRVKRIQGNTFTVVNCLRQRERVHLDHILCYIHHGHVKEQIVTGRRTGDE